MSEIKTRPVTKDYEAGFEKAFGKSSGQRGRWIWDPSQKKLVTPDKYRAPVRALDASIVMDRQYENMASPIDGADIGSRRKHREYMKRHGLVMSEDYREHNKKAAADRAARIQGTHAGDRKEVREELNRAWYQVTGY